MIEAQLAAAALAGLRAQDPRPAALTLRSLARRRRRTDTETLLKRWIEREPSRAPSLGRGSGPRPA